MPDETTTPPDIPRNFYDEDLNNFSYIDRNLNRIRAGIAASCAGSGRDPGEITIIAVAKSAAPEELIYLHEKHGISDIGVNRAQWFRENYSLTARPGMRFHFIGGLQTNKVRQIIDKTALIHSLDSIRLATEISRRAIESGTAAEVLIEINSGREISKSGIDPDDAAEFAAEISLFEGLKLRGFMTMAPKCEKNTDFRKYFSKTYQLVIDIWQEKLHNIGMPIISMGMSGSYEAAVSEGATVVRIGRSLFDKSGGGIPD